MVDDMSKRIRLKSFIAVSLALTTASASPLLTDPILIEDLNGIALDLKDQAVHTYGFSREELVGQPINTVFPDDRHSQADELLQNVVRAKSSGTLRASA